MEMQQVLESVATNLPLSFHIFGLFATITIAGAAGVAFSNNIVYSAFSLLGSFMGVAGLFGLLSADFLAIVQMMVYVGGILVLILFAVMLTNRITDVAHSNPATMRPLGAAIAGAVTITLAMAITDFNWSIKEAAPYIPTSELIGRAFLGPYLLPFEVAGVMLLAALLAATVVARKEIKDDDEELS